MTDPSGGGIPIEAPRGSRNGYPCIEGQHAVVSGRPRHKNKGVARTPPHPQRLLQEESLQATNLLCECSSVSRRRIRKGHFPVGNLFARIVDLWSKEIAGHDIDAACATVKTEIWNLPADDIRAMLSAGLRQHFIPENPDSTPYGIDDMPDFLQWLHDRFELPTVLSEREKAERPILLRAAQQRRKGSR
jgi:hypothetical protein